MESYDVAVVGLGAMGSATLAEVATRGRRVIGVEAASPAHALGSSHGDSRIIRLGYFEDPSYVPLLRRAYRNWRALEMAVREPLLTITGALEIGRPDAPIVRGTRLACEMHDLPFDVLDPERMRERFPVFALDDDEVAVFEPEGGWLAPERAVAAFLAQAGRHGAAMRFGERVSGIEPGDGGVTVVSDGGTIRARTVVVATGPWIGELVPDLRDLAQPIRQVVAWYQPADGFVTSPGRMPVFLRDDREGGSYFGFPVLGRDGFKVGKHTHLREPIDPAAPNPAVNARDTALLDRFVARRLPAAGGTRVAATTCRYTMLPGEDFLLDQAPGEARVIVASPCSGHGFKFASVVGEILADLALEGGTALPVDLFSFARLHETAGRLAAA
jgi:sarcosine oxidase